MNYRIYTELLSSFVTKGFVITKFEDFCASSNGQLILRHDVDFCVKRALQMAKLEEQMGIRSTYYFLLTSESYNLLSIKNSESVKSIQSMGHSVGLHFDATQHADEKKGFENELKQFEYNFGVTRTMSFHRPPQLLLEGTDWLPSRIICAYHKQFFKDIAYISDSGGNFRFGHPLKHSAFKDVKNLQLLIHPIWWMTGGSTNIKKIQEFLLNRSNEMSNHVAKNCKPWAKYND
jgi:hypothetical protein